MAGMKIITINVPKNWISIFDELQRLGLYPSRSECIRVAIRDWMLKELGLANLIDSEEFLTLLSDSYRQKLSELKKDEVKLLSKETEKKEKEKIDGYTQIGNKIVLSDDETTFTLVEKN